MLLMVLINAIVAQNTPRVWTTVLGLVGLIPIYITGNFLFEYMASRVGASVSNDMRMAAFWRLQALSVAYHRGRSRGDATSPMMVCTSGIRPPLPSPCSARARISVSIEGASAQASEPAP